MSTPRMHNPLKPGPARLTRAAASAAALMALAGCKVGPNYQTPEAAVNAQWIDAAAGEPAPTAPELSRWWETFQDPVLTSLVQEAYAQNLTLRAAGLRVIEARARRAIAVGQFFPQQQEAFGGVSANQLSANTPLGQGADRYFDEASLGLQAAWELDFWGKFRRGIESSDALLQASVADYDAVLVTLAADVATAYILVRSFQERLSIAETNVQLQQKTLSLTEVQFRAGIVSELDVVSARATLTNTQALIPEFKNSIRQSTMALCVLLGRTPSSLEAELGPASAGAGRTPVAPASIAAGIPAELLRRRPDVRTAERIAAAQSARIGVAKADLLPQIAITGATGFASSTFEGTRRPDLGNIFDADSFTGFIGLRLNWPILNYGRITNNIRAQDAQYEQAVAAYQEAVLRAAADVETGLSEFLRSREREAFLAQSVAATQRSVDISLLQYRVGHVDFIRVNDAQTRLAEQQDSLVAAKARIALGAVRAYRALGGGWELREGREFVDPATIDRMRDRTNWGDVLEPTWNDGRDMLFKRPGDEAGAETGGAQGKAGER